MEEKQITLQIDGHFITVPEGSTILEVLPSGTVMK